MVLVSLTGTQDSTFGHLLLLMVVIFHRTVLAQTLMQPARPHALQHLWGMTTSVILAVLITHCGKGLSVAL